MGVRHSPMPPCGTLQALARNLSVHGDQPAILAFHRHTVDTWSYASLSNAVSGLASGLIENGLSTREPVAIYSPNRAEWIIACLALLHAGAVPVPIDSQSAGEDLVHVIEDSGTRRIFTVRPLADRLAALGFDRDRTILLLDAGETDPQSWQRLSSRHTRDGFPAKPEDQALLFYTSGASGRPKGVPLTHGNLVSNLQALLDVLVYRSDERLLLPLPLHHVYPFMVGLLAPCMLGLPVILPHSLTGPQMLRALREGNVTGVPRIYSALYEAIEQRVRQKGRVASATFHSLLALSTVFNRTFGIGLGRRLFSPLRHHVGPQLRTLVSGGSALPSDLAWNLAGLGWQVAGGFGLTETSPILTLTVPGSRVIDTAGRALPGVRLRIADSDPETGYGEIQAEGPNVFAGYRHLPDKTADAFTQDGWFRTGDLGYVDRAGYLHVVGRASSRITLPGGEKIWPERIEAIMNEAPSVRESAVLAREGRLVGIVVPHAVSVHKDALDSLAQMIRADLDARLRQVPSYSRLTDVSLSVDPLPRTRLGKLQRHKLRALFEATKQQGNRGLVDTGPISIELMAPEDRQLLEDPVALRTWQWLADRFGSVRLTPDTNIALELGLDSLAWMTLTLELRDRVGIDLPEDAIARIGTVRDLLREAVEAEEHAGAAVDPAVQLEKPEQLLAPSQLEWLAERGWFVRRLGTVLFVLNRLLMKRFFSLEVQGVERILTQGPCVLVPNHTSLLDPPAVMAALSDSFLNRTYWGGWTGIMFRNTLMRLVSRATQVLPIDQSSRPLANIALGAAALARGYHLVWFPEGGRSPDGILQPFQSGIGLMMTAHQVPVIPVWIEGSFEALPTGARWPHRRAIRVVFGETLDAGTLAGPSRGDDRYRRIATALHDRVAALGGRPMHRLPASREA
ncbi:MAG: AMP-binding protein [Nitrospira sp.]|nr:AMP-binding protein [Nitrospira sp.]